MNIFELVKELGFKKCNGTYEGVFATGDFKAIDDYNVGLLTVKINPQLSLPSIVITTIDDGVWHAFASEDFNSSILAKELEDEFGTKLPNEETLNEFLIKFGIFGFKT